MGTSVNYSIGYCENYTFELNRLIIYSVN
jgi:hypothetical protein